MDDRWFIESNNPFGGYDPQIVHGERPVQTKTRRFRTDPVQIDPRHHHLTVAQAFEVYSPDGRFRKSRVVTATEEGFKGDGG